MIPTLSLKSLPSYARFIDYGDGEDIQQGAEIRDFVGDCSACGISGIKRDCVNNPKSAHIDQYAGVAGSQG